MRIRVTIADDHALFRQGLISLLKLDPNVEVVAEIERAGDLAATVRKTRCDILLLDLQMDRSALEEIEQLAEQVAVLVLTASERPEDAAAAIRGGARGVVHKRFAVETLMAAMHEVMAGNVWLPPAFQAVLAAEWTGARPLLTGRETEIVRLVAQGLRNSEIGKRLFISEATVKTHVNNVFQKLGIRDRVELALYAVRVGLATVSRPRS
jgi:DNA-binding NarL/FixJ family response regulator